jgi:hypothetical protein
VQSGRELLLNFVNSDIIGALVIHVVRVPVTHFLILIRDFSLSL